MATDAFYRELRIPLQACHVHVDRNAEAPLVTITVPRSGEAPRWSASAVAWWNQQQKAARPDVDRS